MKKLIIAGLLLIVSVASAHVYSNHSYHCDSCDRHYARHYSHEHRNHYKCDDCDSWWEDHRRHDRWDDDRYDNDSDDHYDNEGD